MVANAQASDVCEKRVGAPRRQNLLDDFEWGMVDWLVMSQT